MSDHNERACTKCGSLLHHEDRCKSSGDAFQPPQPSPLREEVAKWLYEFSGRPYGVVWDNLGQWQERYFDHADRLLSRFPIGAASVPAGGWEAREDIRMTMIGRCFKEIERLCESFQATLKENAALKERVEKYERCEPNPDPEELGSMVRHQWILWAKQQPNPKASWLVEWDRLPEPDKEVDRQIGKLLYSYGHISGFAAKLHTLTAELERVTLERDEANKFNANNVRTLEAAITTARAQVERLEKELAESVSRANKSDEFREKIRAKNRDLEEKLHISIERVTALQEHVQPLVEMLKRWKSWTTHCRPELMPSSQEIDALLLRYTPDQKGAQP